MKYIVTDTETTGLNHEEDGILEIAGVHQDSSVKPFESFCNPGVLISVEAKATHHITEDMIANSPHPDYVVKIMLHKLGYDKETVMVAHNAQFDRGFIGKCYPPLEEPFKWLCTYRCAMHIWPDATGHSNQVLRYLLGVKLELPDGLYPHRALYDVIVTKAILERMLETHTLEQLINLTQKPVLLTKVRFGKHKGAQWKDLPKDYLKWICNQQDMDADVRHTAHSYLHAQGRMF